LGLLSPPVPLFSGIHKVRTFYSQWAHSKLGYPKGWSIRKMIAKDYFGFLLHSLSHDYNGFVYDYN
jgi:hypothetical protein